MNFLEGPLWDTKYGRALQLIALGSSLLVTFAAAFILLILLYKTGFLYWAEVVKTNFLATIGIVGFSVMSFGVVTLLRQTEGPIEFEGLGFKFEGASGQVVLWALGVVVLSACAGALWN